MNTEKRPTPPPPRRARAAPRHHLAAELLGFVLRTKKWWLVPLLVALVVFSAFALLGGTALAPFIYPLF